MIVLTIVFGTLMGEHDKAFPVYILSGRLLYGFFSQSTTAALKSIRANSSIIKKVYVPKILYPLSSIIFNYIIFLISLIVLAAVPVVLDVYPTIYLLQAFHSAYRSFAASLGCGLDTFYDRCILQRYGVSVECRSDAYHVYLRYFL